MNLKVQSNGLPNIANISCCDFVVKFAQMQKVITSNLHLGQVENGMGLVIATQHCQKCHSRHEPQMWDEEIAGITQSCQVLLNSWLLSKYEGGGKYSEKCDPRRRHLSCVLWWDPLHEESDLNEWIIGIVTLPANILQTSPHTTHSGLRRGSKHSDRRISNRDVCRHESDQRWIKHFNFRFYGWLQILSLLKDEDIYNI